jgi:hypothetical protein
VTKKPRSQVMILSHTTEVLKQEFRNCDAPNCPNIISMYGKPKGYSGPIYCILHAHLMEEK